MRSRYLCRGQSPGTARSKSSAVPCCPRSEGPHPQPGGPRSPRASPGSRRTPPRPSP